MTILDMLLDQRHQNSTPMAMNIYLNPPRVFRPENRDAVDSESTASETADSFYSALTSDNVRDSIESYEPGYQEAHSFRSD